MLRLVAILSLVLTGIASAQDTTIYMRMGKNALPIHMPTGALGKNIATEIAFEDYVFFVEDICTSLALECDFYIRNANIKNASALIFEENGVRTKVLVYDRRLSSQVGLWGAIALIAHEIGHHVCGHTGEKPVAAWKSMKINMEQELQTDRIAGAALRKIPEFNIDDIEKVLGPVLSKTGSSTHPPAVARFAAIREGWSNPDGAVACKN